MKSNNCIYYSSKKNQPLFTEKKFKENIIEKLRIKPKKYKL